MQKCLYLLICFLFSDIAAHTQLKSGPMLGPIELRTAQIWCEVEKGTNPELVFWKLGAESRKINLKPEVFKKFGYRICKFYLTGLDFNTVYEYELLVGNKKKEKPVRGKFKTQDLWQYRKPAGDFSFLAGSCAFVNEGVYDRPGKPYGGDSVIFKTMAQEPAVFMIWLGDNWYYREVDYFSEWGLWYRASRDRSQPVLQDFLKSMSHYAIWDDHDYGPNNEGKAYVFKSEARDVFQNYWCNPPCSSASGGIYTKFQYNDVDFFLMDDRSFRASDQLRDSIDGKPNPDKRMWGAEQMDWLKNQLANSRASFKVICNGSSILNIYNKFDCLVHFPIEYNDLLQFIADEKINGVVFFTGDRHHSEVIKHPLPNGYQLYEFLNSSLTAGVYKLNDFEKTNPMMLPDMLVEQNNYTRASVSGPARQRTLKVEFVDKSGKSLAAMKLSQQDLMFEK